MNVTNVEPAALRMRDAAKFCGIGRTTLYQMISDGKLPNVKVGGRRLIPLAALKALVAPGGTNTAKAA